jgi:hypothetical protein
MKGSVGEENGDMKLVGRKQTEDGGYGSLHGILGMSRNPVPDNLGVERLDPKQEVGERGELSVGGSGCRSCGVDEVIGDATPACAWAWAWASAGEDAADGGAGGGTAEVKGWRDCERESEVVRKEGGFGNSGGGGHRSRD